MTKRFSITKAEVEKLTLANEGLVKANYSLKQENIRLEKLVTELKQRFNDTEAYFRKQITAMEFDILKLVRLIPPHVDIGG